MKKQLDGGTIGKAGEHNVDIGGTSTLKGLREYLMLLSISETCKFKSVRFLDFLLSQEPDIDRYRNRTGRRRIVPSYDYLKGQL